MTDQNALREHDFKGVRLDKDIVHSLQKALGGRQIAWLIAMDTNGVQVIAVPSGVNARTYWSEDALRKDLSQLSSEQSKGIAELFRSYEHACGLVENIKIAHLGRRGQKSEFNQVVCDSDENPMGGPCIPKWSTFQV